MEQRRRPGQYHLMAPCKASESIVAGDDSRLNESGSAKESHHAEVG